MIHTLTGEINEVFPTLVARTIALGTKETPRGTTTLELHPVFVEIHNPQNRLVTSFGRQVNVAFALAEQMWILAGREDVAMLKAYNSNIEKFSDDGVIFNASYGARLRWSAGIDQLEDVIHTLQADPTSRQATISLWGINDRGWDRYTIGKPPGDEGPNPIKYVPHVTKDRACNVLAHLMIRNEKLDWTQVIRSNDAIWGFPYNMMQWTCLMEVVANRLKVPMGKYYHLADSFHIYDHHWDEARNISSFSLYNVPVGGYAISGSHYPIHWNDDIEDLIIGNERELRIGNDLCSDFQVTGNLRPEYRYWIAALEILRSWHLYKAGEDFEALEAIKKCDDFIYAMAQLRFYIANRWYKEQYRSILINVKMFMNSRGYVSALQNWVLGDTIR